MLPDENDFVPSTINRKEVKLFRIGKVSELLQLFLIFLLFFTLHIMNVIIFMKNSRGEEKVRKYRFEIIIFIVNAIYMILELIASRVLSPYFGNSNMIWTSIIGIILLSTSVGNYLGGVIADKKNSVSNVKYLLIFSGFLIMLIPLIQKGVLVLITYIFKDIRIGAIIATLFLFFLPSMTIGMISPIIVKLKMENLENVGKISGNISAIATLGSIVGTFLGGFWLLPNIGSNQLLFILAMIMFLLFFIVEKNKIHKITVFVSICIILSIIFFCIYIIANKVNGEKVLIGDLNTRVNYDTQYGKVVIYNTKQGDNIFRHMMIDKGNESATYIAEEKCYDLIYEYTKFYDLMFEASIEIKDCLMIGGAGYSYPKYYISNYTNKNMDVVEIDEDVTKLAKEYFYLDKLIEEYDLENNKRLNIITEDGRTYLNKNTKKYDAILNDAFSGSEPAETLTTIEAVQKIHDSLNPNGVYLTNIISALDENNSKFLKAEVNTLKQVFKNVYIVPCNNNGTNSKNIQNFMVVATDDTLELNNTIELNLNDTFILTDNYCPVDSLTPDVI